MKILGAFFVSVFVVLLFCGFGLAAYSDDGKYIGRYKVDNETACGCSVPGAYLMWGSPNDLSAGCTYYHEPENTVEGAQILYISASFTNWDKIESTKQTLQLHKEQQYEPDSASYKKSDRMIAVEDFVEEDGFSLIGRSNKVGYEYRNSEKKQFEYIVNRQVRYDDYALISVKGRWRTNGEEPQDASVLATIDAMEACMKGVIDRSLNDGTSKSKMKLLVEGKPMKHVVVYAKGGENKWTTTDDKGEFSLSVKDSENFDFVVDMKYNSDGHDYFRMIGKDRDEAFKLLFNVEDGEVESIAIDNGDFKLPVHDVGAKIGEDIHLDKYLSVEEGLIGPLIHYIHFGEVLEYYKDVLKVDLTSRTLDVLLYAGDSASYNYENDRSWILMDKGHSDYENEYRPFVDYHEFSHYVQHMLYGKTFEESLELFNINHGGYANPTTSDSFSEGFAAFMPVIIANHYGRYWARSSLEKRTSLYPLSGSLDTNWLAWDRQGAIEEISIAGILWDLMDGKEDYNADIKVMEKDIRAALTDMIAETDMDKDGFLSKREVLFAKLNQQANLDLDDYLDKEELDTINDSEFNEYLEKNNKLDNLGRVSVEDFWIYFVSDWADIEKEWKESDPKEYAEIPEKTGVEDFMKMVSDPTDDDEVDLTFEQIWGVLKKPHADFTSVYNSFAKIASKAELDEVFVSHGFFMETSEGDKEYNKGEPFLDLDDDGKWDERDELYVDLGNMSFDSGEIVGTASNSDRKLRKSFEPMDGEYVKVNEEVPYYEIRYIVYGLNYYGLKIPSEVYSIRASNVDGLIYVPMQKDAVVEIVPMGVESESPLVFSVAEFERDYEEVLGDGYFVEHEFDYEGEVPVYKNPLAESGNRFGFWIGLVMVVGLVFGIFRNRKFMGRLSNP